MITLQQNDKVKSVHPLSNDFGTVYIIDCVDNNKAIANDKNFNAHINNGYVETYGQFQQYNNAYRVI